LAADVWFAFGDGCASFRAKNGRKRHPVGGTGASSPEPAACAAVSKPLSLTFTGSVSKSCAFSDPFSCPDPEFLSDAESQLDAAGTESPADQPPAAASWPPSGSLPKL
jgi:hypothetical protein